MNYKSEKGSSFWGTVMVLVILGTLAIYIIHLCQKAINESRADSILNGVVELAEHEKDRMEESSTLDSEQTIIGSIERKGYSFTAVEGSTPSLVKIETEKKVITPSVCRILKKKLKKSMWHDTFQKVLIIDRMGDEKTDILIYDCPHDRIPALRFYVKFEGEQPLQETEEEKEETEADILPPPPPPPAAPSTYSPSRTSTPSYTTRTPSCPAGTSQNGSGGYATAGCKCNHAGESWNGKNCQQGCPFGSSRYISGDTDATNVAGCHCNTETPVWTGKRCVRKCPNNKIFDEEKNECVCPANMMLNKNSPDTCVECNRTADCSEGYICSSHKCTTDQREYDDCRWGICQTCDLMGTHRNITEAQPCEVAGLSGVCNGNGTCYPTEGRRCSAVRKCPSGEFCNYGGNYNSTKKQKGKFGQTANMCQIVDPQEFTYEDVTYYFNSKKDLKSWCRAANNTANCKWGYLAKPGAESWCASLGKRLLTRAEMAKVWSVLRTQLPQTYTGFAYWVKEGVWLENKQGKLSFGTAHADGYGGRGGVVCK